MLARRVRCRRRQIRFHESDAGRFDAIDEPNRRGKHDFFQDMLSAHGLRPDEVLVVGDNPDSEIEAGNRLGMKTIQVLRPGVPPSERAARQIRGLMELKVLL